MLLHLVLQMVFSDDISYNIPNNTNDMNDDNVDYNDNGHRSDNDDYSNNEDNNININGHYYGNHVDNGGNVNYHSDACDGNNSDNDHDTWHHSFLRF